MGLPGSGKTTLASTLSKLLTSQAKTVTWLNADEVRRQFNDWDFSPQGRIRQAQRMRELSESANTDYVIVDFVAPLPEMRDIFAADFVVWVDTIQQGRFEDTNRAFIPPEIYNMRVTEQDATKWAGIIIKDLGSTL